MATSWNWTQKKHFTTTITHYQDIAFCASSSYLTKLSFSILIFVFIRVKDERKPPVCLSDLGGWSILWKIYQVKNKMHRLRCRKQKIVAVVFISTFQTPILGILTLIKLKQNTHSAWLTKPVSVRPKHKCPEWQTGLVAAWQNNDVASGPNTTPRWKV